MTSIPDAVGLSDIGNNLPTINKSRFNKTSRLEPTTAAEKDEWLLSGEDRMKSYQSKAQL